MLPGGVMDVYEGLLDVFDVREPLDHVSLSPSYITFKSF